MSHNNKEPIKEFTIYLISDATGTTLQGLARACLAQFDEIEPVERFWPMIRSEAQLDKALNEIRGNPGPVLFTLVDSEQRRKVQRLCHEINVPCMPVLDPILRNLSSYLGLPTKGVPGLQHALDEAYFKRIDAVDFALSFDDGRNVKDLEDADVVLVGVSRTSKTPTCIFLARRGIKAANVPWAPGVPFPESVAQLENPLIVGLTESPNRLVNLRKTRVNAHEDSPYLRDNSYLDPEKIEQEIREARRFFSKNKWPVIDVTRRSIEETAAEVMVILRRHKEKKKASHA